MEDVSIDQNDSRMKIATRNIILMMIGKNDVFIRRRYLYVRNGVICIKDDWFRDGVCNYARLRITSKDDLWSDCGCCS